MLEELGELGHGLADELVGSLELLGEGQDQPAAVELPAPVGEDGVALGVEIGVLDVAEDVGPDPEVAAVVGPPKLQGEPEPHGRVEVALGLIRRREDDVVGVRPGHLERGDETERAPLERTLAGRETGGEEDARRQDSHELRGVPLSRPTSVGRPNRAA